jgi:predicted DNA-binding transcriptional regulator AlpA
MMTTTAQTAEPVVIGLRQAAERVGLSEASFRWLRHIGKAPQGAVIGRRVMFRVADVDRWIDEQFAAGDGA